MPLPPWSSPENVNVMEVEGVFPPSFTLLLLPSMAESIVVSGAIVSFTSIDTVAVLLTAPLLSLTVKVKVSVPMKPGSGV